MALESDLIYDWNAVTGPEFKRLRRPMLDDETLRDGLQSPSVLDPSIEKKIQILHLMEDLGIDSVDLGLPGAGPRAKADVLRLAQEMAAFEAGADQVHGTALGVGERVGNTPMDQILLNLKLMGAIDPDLRRLKEYCGIGGEDFRSRQASRSTLDLRGNLQYLQGNEGVGKALSAQPSAFSHPHAAACSLLNADC
jgi:hypothetical protein